MPHRIACLILGPVYRIPPSSAKVEPSRQALLPLAKGLDSVRALLRGALHVGATNKPVLSPSLPKGKPSWQALLDLAMGLDGVRALLDCGALLVGATNK